MIDSLLIYLYVLMWIFLVITVIVFIISGIDDLFFDIFYWSQYLYKRLKGKRKEVLTYKILHDKKEKRLAIMIPCWDESNVIAQMLAHNCRIIDYKNYDIFVGTYPNDSETIHAVNYVRKFYPQVHAATGTEDGPSNKAKNLNQIYKYIKAYEKKNNVEYAAYIFHDAEDMIHPLSLKLYNYHMPQNDMIQIPIFPLVKNKRFVTHWTYCDEFSEIHTKDIIVREAINGFVPSAGVGTAFTAHALMKLSALNKNNQPFATDSVTEDYETSLVLNVNHMKAAFISQRIKRTAYRKKYIFWGQYVTYINNEYIATRAFFPDTYFTSVRQKSRWIFGTAIQQWMHSGWPGNFAVKYSLFHDRKSLISHFFNPLAYFVMIFWYIYELITLSSPEFPTLQDKLNNHHWIWYSIIFTTILMTSRLLQRFIATTRVYGIDNAFLSLPRTIYCNIINLHALIRALKLFLSKPKKTSSTKISWDKTHHTFPSTLDISSKEDKLASILVRKGLITKKELVNLLDKQSNTGEQIGMLVVNQGIISLDILRHLIAEQKDIEVLFYRPEILFQADIPDLKKSVYDWLIKNEAYPIEYDETNKKITIAIYDILNGALIKSIEEKLSEIEVNIVMLLPKKG